MRERGSGGASLNSRCASSKRTPASADQGRRLGGALEGSDATTTRMSRRCAGLFSNLSAANIMGLPSTVCIGSERLSAGSPEEFLAALRFQRQDATLDGADTGTGDVAVSAACTPSRSLQRGRQGAKVFQIEAATDPCRRSILNTAVSTPLWCRSGSGCGTAAAAPISATVARAG